MINRKKIEDIINSEKTTVVQVPSNYEKTIGRDGSLRESGYDNPKAIMDLTDNSRDAILKKFGPEDLSKGFIRVRSNSKEDRGSFYNERCSLDNKFIDELLDDNIESFHIIDNGCGMSPDMLVEALRFGSDTPHGLDDFGYYGMGLKTASFSMCCRIEIMTRDKQGGEVVRAVYDLDRSVVSDGPPKIFLIDGEDSREEIKFFNSELGDSTGTIVKLMKLDRLDRNKNATRFGELLANENNMGRV